MKKLLMIFVSLMFCLSVQAKSKEIILSEDNTLILSSAFTNDSVSTLMEEAKQKDANLKSGYPLYLFLYTPGGSIQAGLELIEYLNGLNRPVHTITMFSASMGFQTVQHLGKRYILKYGVLMSHKARGGFQGDFGGGFSQLDSRYGMWLRRVDMMDKKTVARSNKKQTLTTYRAAYANELWLNGPEAVEQGYADAVITPKCGGSLVGHREAVENFGFFRIKLKFSKCPLNTSPTGIVGFISTNKGEMSVKDFLAKNGKFGKNCNSHSTPIRKRFYDYEEREERVTLPKKENLCAMDETLSLQKIMKKIQERKTFHNRDLKSNIVYSY